VNKLGKSSVTYEIGVFREPGAGPVAVGGYTHVFVDRESRKSQPMEVDLKEGFSRIAGLEEKAKL